MFILLLNNLDINKYKYIFILICENGNLEMAQYLLSIDPEVWYNTPGIKLQNCFDISFNKWPVVDLGIKQGQLNYDNTFIVPLNLSIFISF